MNVDVDRMVTQASKAYRALKKAVFLDKHLRLTTKRNIVLFVLLYGMECWVSLRKQEKKLDTFHHRWYLGHSNKQ